MTWRSLLLLLSISLCVGCEIAPPKKVAKKKPAATTKTKAKGSAPASTPQRVRSDEGPPPLQQITVAGEAGPRPIEVPDPSRIRPRTAKEIAAGRIKFDADIYLEKTVTFSRYKMRHDIEGFNKIAADMIRKNKYSSELSGPLSAAWMNLSNRHNEAAVTPPNVPGMNRIQRELKAAVAAYEKCLTDVYGPLREEINSRQFEGDAPIAALEQAIKDGTAALEAWDKPLGDALDAWKKNGQAEIEASVN